MSSSSAPRGVKQVQKVPPKVLPPVAKKTAVKSSFSSGPTTWAPPVAMPMQREKRKESKKKKKESKAMSFLRGAAKVAAAVAPAVLPLLVAGHAPTNMAAKAAGVTGVPDLNPVQTGVATSVSVAKYATGTFVPTYKQSGGRVIGVSWPGCEEIATVAKPPSGNVWRTGDVMVKLSLNPASADWVGTKIQVQSRLWQNFRIKKMSVLYQPATSTLINGQMVGFCSNDPDEDFTLNGEAAVRSGLAHQFSDIFNVWSVGCIGMATDANQQDKYTQGDGSDPRLTSPGDFYLLCSADIDMSTVSSLGTLIIAYEFDFSVPSDLDEAYFPGAGVTYQWTTPWSYAAAGAYAYVGAGTADFLTPSKKVGQLSNSSQLVQFSLPSGAFSRGVSLPPGCYFCGVEWGGTGSGTNAGTNILIQTSVPADTTGSNDSQGLLGNVEVMTPVGARLTPNGNAQSGILTSAQCNVNNFAGGARCSFNYVLKSDKPISVGIAFSNTTQTGAWTATGGTTLSFMSINASIFSLPTVPPLEAIRRKLDDTERENADLSRRVDAMSAYLATLVRPEPASVPWGDRVPTESSHGPYTATHF